MLFRYIKSFNNLLRIKTINILLVFLIAALCINGCSDNANNKQAEPSLIVGLSADYPPFEFMQNGEFMGLDVDLARLIGKHLHKKIEFKDLSYSNLFTALNAGQIDLAISTITFTEERNKHFALSEPYYWADIALIFRKDQMINELSAIKNKKVGAQLGSTMEIWAKSLGELDLVTMDVSLQLIEALKSKQIDVVVSETAQAKEFCKRNSDLQYLIAAKSENGYVVALRKGSLLLPEINLALAKIKQQAEWNDIKNQWLDLMFEMEVHDAS